MEGADNELFKMKVRLLYSSLNNSVSFKKKRLQELLHFS